MLEIHCHSCGGFISELRHISYRLPSDSTARAIEHRDLCTCTVPIVYGPPAGYRSSPGIPISGHRGA